MIGPPAGTRVWLAAGVTDLRKGLDGLAALVQEALSEDPFSGQVFMLPRHIGVTDDHDLLEAAQVTAGYVSRLLPLGLLAPDIVEAIASGRQPIELTTETFTRSELPSCWKDQCTMLRFV